MKIEQIYTGCLAQGAYYIESEGEAAIVDPMREIDAYIQKAAASGSKIKYIFETHFHADFVSGHIDLARKTGATIIYGPQAKTEFAIYSAKDGEVFDVGKLKIKTLHTPGHTLESTTYLLKDENGKDHCIFSGDTLFIGDVGRPDLAIKTGLTKEDLASLLFDSLREKILPLADDVIVYPAHGAGSACGKNMAKETWDTLGNQKVKNYALSPSLSREDFIKEVTDIMPAPQYFAKNALINKTGYESMDHVLKRGNQPLTAQEFEDIVNAEGALMLDTRSAAEFAEAHIPNSIFIGIDGTFAPWVGAMITDLNQAIVFMAPEGMESEVVTRLSRVGYDNTLGYLKGGMQEWKESGKEISTVDCIDAKPFAELVVDAEPVVLDVRRTSEYGSAHLEGALNLPLDYLNSTMDKVDRETTYHVHCAGGYRSMIFISILQARGYENLINVNGGWGAISKELPQEEIVAS